MRTLAFFTGVVMLSSIGLAAQGREATPGAVESRGECSVSKGMLDTPPEDPNAAPFGSGPWHINPDRTIWVWDKAYKAGDANERLWIRPSGTQLVVVGRRLDREAPPLQSVIPCCYPTGFQASGLLFPTEGCWEVTGTAGSSKLTFVTKVEGRDPPLDESELGVPVARLVDPASGFTVSGNSRLFSYQTPCSIPLKQLPAQSNGAARVTPALKQESSKGFPCPRLRAMIPGRNVGNNGQHLRRRHLSGFRRRVQERRPPAFLQGGVSRSDARHPAAAMLPALAAAGPR